MNEQVINSLRIFTQIQTPASLKKKDLNSHTNCFTSQNASYMVYRI